MEANEWLGVLFNHWEWNKIKKGISEEQVKFYLEAAQQYKVNLCFFCLSDVSLKDLTVGGYINANSSWHKQDMPLPKVIHNRAIYRRKGAYTKLKELEKQGITIYNSWNGYEKLYIHQILEQNSTLQPYLPITRLFTKDCLHYFLQDHSFFLKPDIGSVGNGILKVSRISTEDWEVTQQTDLGVRKGKMDRGQLSSYLKRYVGEKGYFLQETIDLLTFCEAPCDIRVSVQKNGSGKWQVTGMVGKVAKKGSYLSNVAKGGTVKRVEQLLAETNLNPEMVKETLAQLALHIINYLEPFIPHLADVGFDFGINKAGHPYFIEMNGRDQRYSFLLANMEDTFYQTYENPIAYGSYLLEEKPYHGNTNATHR